MKVSYQVEDDTLVLSSLLAGRIFNLGKAGLQKHVGKKGLLSITNTMTGFCKAGG